MDRHETAVSGSGAPTRPGDEREVALLLLHCLTLSVIGALMWVAALAA